MSAAPCCPNVFGDFGFNIQSDRAAGREKLDGEFVAAWHSIVFRDI